MEEHNFVRKKSNELQMIKEDENRSHRKPKDPLQAINLQENSMDESLIFEFYATSLENLLDDYKKWISRALIESS